MRWWTTSIFVRNVKSHIFHFQFRNVTAFCKDDKQIYFFLREDRSD